MTSPIADSVLAATHKLVQQAMTGQWQEVPRTVAERRVLLDKLSASAAPQDQEWLSALKQAMAESDAVVARMAPPAEASAPAAVAPTEKSDSAATAVDSMMEMLRGR